LPALLLLSQAACVSTKQARTVEPHGFLVDYSRLQPGTGDQMLLRYVKPGVDVKGYTKILVDPFLIVVKEKQSDSMIADLHKAADVGYCYLREELGKDYVLVQTPEKGALRIQCAVTDARKAMPVWNVITSLCPLTLGISLVKDAVTGKPVAVGEATLEIRVTDAITGEILGEGVDRRVGGKHPKNMFDSWSEVDAALRWWAQRARYVLCVGRQGEGCVKPE
jgi:hypothetical protein